MPLATSALTQRLTTMKTYEPFYGRAFWNMMATQDITDDFIEDLAIKLATWQNISIFVLGSPGTGKSIVGMALGRIVNVLVEATLGHDRPYTVKGNVRSDMTSYVQLVERAKDFDVFVQDEVLKLMGMGSATIINQLKNLMKAVARHKQISTVMVGNEFLTMRLYDYVLLTRDRYVNDEDWRKTDWVSCEVWARVWESLEGNYFPIGRITIPTAVLGEDWMKEYEKREKMGKVRNVQREGGFTESEAMRRNYIQKRKGIGSMESDAPPPAPAPAPKAEPPKYIEQEAPCLKCHRKTVRGFRDGKAWKWMCFNCGEKLPDTPVD